ncbi:MAG TPA: hypothetical protein VF498_18790, partial [Anaerolineales bacterium]
MQHTGFAHTDSHQPAGCLANREQASGQDRKAGPDPGPGCSRQRLSWDPARSGCPLTDADLATATYEVTSSLDAPTVYPEYNLL